MYRIRNFLAKYVREKITLRPSVEFPSKFIAWLDIQDERKGSVIDFVQFLTTSQVGFQNVPTPGYMVKMLRRLSETGFIFTIGNSLHESVTLILNHDGTELLGDYGAFDFLVEGFSHIRHRKESAILHLESTSHGETSSGTAFWIYRQPFIITAAHCVTDGEQFRISTVDSECITAIFVHKRRDLALIVTSDSSPEGLFIGAASVLGRVMAMGFPNLGTALPALITTTGEVSGTTCSYLSDEPYLITSCPIAGGSSGGPLVNETGQAVGVISRFGTDRNGTTNFGFGFCTPLTMEDLVAVKTEFTRFEFQVKDQWIVLEAEAVS